MALQTFTAGQVLTAAQVNALQANDYNQTVSTKTGDYVLVAADKGTRVVMNSASAQTITVNTDLFSAGDTLFIQNIGAGVCTITAGTATVSTAGSLALVENAGGTLYFISAGVAVFYPSGVAASSGGLTHISTSTLSTNANLQVDNVFTSSFANYRIIISMTTSANSKIYFKTSESGTPSGTYGFNNAFFSNVTVLSRNASTSAIPLGNTITAAEIATLSLDVFSPQLNAKTQVMGNYFQFLEVGLVSGARTTAAQSDGFFLDLDSGTMTGTVRVYGYENS
jgi:hypothetical protein